jgi:hypothetical protein
MNARQITQAKNNITETLLQHHAKKEVPHYDKRKSEQGFPGREWCEVYLHQGRSAEG